jgi:hypothetical protein
LLCTPFAVAFANRPAGADALSINQLFLLTARQKPRKPRRCQRDIPQRLRTKQTPWENFYS